MTDSPSLLSRRRLILAPVALAPLALGGCITLLPKQKPVQLYRFVYDPSELDSAFENRPAPQGSTGFSLSSLDMPQASRGDRLLTSEGQELSYIADARWAAPAEELLSSALSEGFSRSGKGVRLETRGPPSDFRLEVHVRRFESHYQGNRPTVIVAADVRISQGRQRLPVGERFVVGEVPLRRNHVADIVEGYGVAVSQVVAGVIQACEAVAIAHPPAPPEAAVSASSASSAASSR